MSITNYDLDESIVRDFYKQNDNVILKLEGAMTSTEKYIDGVLTLHSVSNVLIKINPKDNINPNQDIGMFSESGELLGIKIENHRISFLIEWNNFVTHIDNTISYAMNFDNLTWQTIGEERETLVNMNSD
jgi:hypothetical protein